MSGHFSFPYRGDAERGEVIAAALQRVIDPEMALGIVDLGLVYGVEAEAARVRVRMTMTSAACPVTDLIVDDVVREIGAALNEGVEVQVEVCWEPPWDPQRMSPRARRALGA